MHEKTIEEILHHKYSSFLHNALLEMRGNESFLCSVKGGEKEFTKATGCACSLVHGWPRHYLLCEKLLYFSTTIHRFVAHVFGSHRNPSYCRSSVVIHLISHIPYSSQNVNSVTPFCWRYIVRLPVPVCNILITT